MFLQRNWEACIRMKVGDPPGVPTPIEPCPKCKKREGWIWHWSDFNAKIQTGHSECEACGALFK